MERLSYKDGCGVREYTRIGHLKEELGWATDKRLWLIINKMLYKTSYTTKNLKNKADLI